MSMLYHVSTPPQPADAVSCIDATPTRFARVCPRRAAAVALQEQAFGSLPYVPLGYYIHPAAWRRAVTGVFPAPTTVYWNIGKSA